MTWYNILPTNKYIWIGFILMFIGFFTLPILIGFAIMPVGITIFIFGIYKAFFDIGKMVYDFIQKFKK